MYKFFCNFPSLLSFYFVFYVMSFFLIYNVF